MFSSGENVQNEWKTRFDLDLISSHQSKIILGTAKSISGTLDLILRESIQLVSNPWFIEDIDYYKTNGCQKPPSIHKKVLNFKRSLNHILVDQ